MFLMHPLDFGGLNPLLPHHFVRIATRAWGALQRNDWRAAEKDL